MTLRAYSEIRVQTQSLGAWDAWSLRCATRATRGTRTSRARPAEIECAHGYACVHQVHWLAMQSVWDVKTSGEVAGQAETSAWSRDPAMLEIMDSEPLRHSFLPAPRNASYATRARTRYPAPRMRDNIQQQLFGPPAIGSATGAPPACTVSLAPCGAILSAQIGFRMKKICDGYVVSAQQTRTTRRRYLPEDCRGLNDNRTA